VEKARDVKMHTKFSYSKDKGKGKGKGKGKVHHRTSNEGPEME
jgi:hypothetical protein